MILSSDKLSGLGKPVVQLKLDTTSGSDAQVQENVVELDLNELTALLKALKSAQSVNGLFNLIFQVFIYHSCSSYVFNSGRASEITGFRFVSFIFDCSHRTCTCCRYDQYSSLKKDR